MATLFDVVRNVAVWCSIALLLWGAAICLRELLASTFGARAPRDLEAREDGEPWIAALHNEES